MQAAERRGEAATLFRSTSSPAGAVRDEADVTAAQIAAIFNGNNNVSNGTSSSETVRNGPNESGVVATTRPRRAIRPDGRHIGAAAMLGTGTRWDLRPRFTTAPCKTTPPPAVFDSRRRRCRPDHSLGANMKSPHWDHFSAKKGPHRTSIGARNKQPAEPGRWVRDSAATRLRSRPLRGTEQQESKFRPGAIGENTIRTRAATDRSTQM